MIKIISLIILYSLLILVIYSSKTTYATYFEAHLSRLGAKRAKEISKKRDMKLQRIEELSHKKRT